ncbi:WcaF family extracellular polysaccharide biosynthesis acetyltransferase [Paradesertivirga mongoliensis]|uniref:WcaF family extracellular polysaccharide biosynthesis acetyltransferase n=1 Tax=Paradesertivirga mongoliensis TaxID=2100740 RepID=A0ABW4ZG70_9SPHI|nr:WcaF family extracellular polysaccharide biosynthesis acetyltransferase [Pedobacter mongoliensis]
MKETQLKKAFDTKDWTPGASSLKVFLWYFVNALIFRSGIIPFSVILVGILRLFGAKIGKDVRIKPFIHIKYPWRLTLGDHSWLAECYIENLAPVTIGKNVCVSQQAMLLTGNHNFKKSTFDLMVDGITLEDGVWIGARATVCPGVICKSHSVLSVGSVATKDLEPYSIYQGVPAVKVRDRVIE